MDSKRIEQTFSEVSKTTGWAVDKRISLAVTNIYLGRGQKFDAGLHEGAVNIIKKNEGWTSPLRSHLLHVAAAFIVLKEESIESSLKLVNQNQQALNDAGFWKTSYTYLAALMMKNPEEATRARALYEEMKKHHKFLTSNEDIPYAALLGSREGTVEERAATMNMYYKDLREQGFSMGNDLQWLSQIMTFESPAYNPEMVGKVLAIQQFFKDEKIKIKYAQYPTLGFLAVTGVGGNALNEIVSNTRELESNKIFRWYKDMAFSTAVQQTMADNIKGQDIVDMAFSTSLEALMQAQQAAMMVSINAAIISTTNNSST
ncbi:hypothetical protein GPDM_14071 [Planococcus donghaensis MPA1U2]|uniref:DUF4003 domain-containing protein n=1 Tax=Planococcus donghaensis MPA1U2 TaxID=933115 RepID=E7RJZ4_9BACL|nr:DUF4003 family protein [Planococcus donghaensis]EGA88600.1 hypothetical protein GPDM_14071 [Planococcus donghaensis MPA1U2]